MRGLFDEECNIMELWNQFGRIDQFDFGVFGRMYRKIPKEYSRIWMTKRIMLIDKLSNNVDHTEVLFSLLLISNCSIRDEDIRGKSREKHKCFFFFLSNDIDRLVTIRFETFVFFIRRWRLSVIVFFLLFLANNLIMFHTKKIVFGQILTESIIVTQWLPFMILKNKSSTTVHIFNRTISDHSRRMQMVDLCCYCRINRNTIAIFFFVMCDTKRFLIGLLSTIFNERQIEWLTDLKWLMDKPGRRQRICHRTPSKIFRRPLLVTSILPLYTVDDDVLRWGMPVE